MNQTKALITHIVMTLFPQQPKCPRKHSGGILIKAHSRTAITCAWPRSVLSCAHTNVWLRSIGIDHAAWATRPLLYTFSARKTVTYIAWNVYTCSNSRIESRIVIQVLLSYTSIGSLKVS